MKDRRIIVVLGTGIMLGIAGALFNDPVIMGGLVVVALVMLWQSRSIEEQKK